MSRPIGTSGSTSTNAGASNSNCLNAPNTDFSSDSHCKASHNNANKSSIRNPWPYLDKFFQCKVKEGNSLKFACLLCKPRNVEISAYITSPSNLQKHVKVRHPSHFKEYTTLTSLARKRKLTLPLANSSPTSNSSSITSTSKRLILTDVSTTKTPSQATVDKCLIDLICQELLPFQILESSAFRQFIHVLQPNMHIMSKAMLKCKLEQEVEKMKAIVKTHFKNTNHIVTTIDCWTARYNNFIGLTAHWINHNTLKRQSAALSWKRLKGSHIFNEIASAIDEIHSDYGIRDKVVRTTVGNGSNFIKACSTFEFHHISSISSESASSNAEVVTSVGQDSDPDEIASEIYYQEAFFTLETSPSFAYILPRHQQCAYHILHLIARKDALNAETELSFKKLYRSSFGKLNELWNKVRCSDTVAKFIEECGIQLIQPCKTNWSSFYSAVERVTMIQKERGKEFLNQVFQALYVQILTTAEQGFLEDYCATLKPLTKALGILQSEKSAYMGWLLPTLYELQLKMEKVKQSTPYCKVLASAIIDGIQTRFGSMMEDEELIAAAILIPKFKTEWTTQKAIIEKGLDYLRKKLQQHSESENISQEETASDDDDFFSSINKRSLKSHAELNGYLGITSIDFDVFNFFPNLKSLFIKLNTPIPATAASDKSFNSAKLFLHPNRANIHSNDFENQLLLKLNANLLLNQ